MEKNYDGIQELSIEHYLLEFPEDKALSAEELDARYNAWTHKYIEEILANQHIDYWKDLPPYEL